MRPLVELRGVCRDYRIGDEVVPALRGVDLDIMVGDYVALVGQSGSGKSTLMNILGFLDSPTAGSYLFRGEDSVGYGEAELASLRARDIGFVFQSFNLLPRATALENVLRPLTYQGVDRRRRLERAEEALRQVGLLHRRDHLPNQLSGGQRQRVAIARALCSRPSILIADEPTGNLDSATSEEVLAIFDRLHLEGATIVMVTHEPSIAARCVRTVTLSDGRIVRSERR